MKLFIDTEFNEFQGELISMALVAENGHYFYESLDCENPGTWVAEHVMPIIYSEPRPKLTVQLLLQRFLCQCESIHVVADWPEDIQHFCAMLITGPGTRLNTPPLTMEVRRDLDAVSLLPHNALADARAMREVYMSLEN